MISTHSMAQTAHVPDHPRENEVNQRLNNQQARIDHITKAEQNRLNKSENKNSKRIYRQKH